MKNYKFTALLLLTLAIGLVIFIGVSNTFSGTETAISEAFNSTK